MTGTRRLPSTSYVYHSDIGTTLTFSPDFQGNLDERCTDALIWELMLQAGPVGEFLYLHV